MNIRLEHIIILALVVFIFFRQTKNEERLCWVDYRGYKYDIKIDRKVH